MSGLSKAQKIRSAVQIIVGGHVIAAAIATYVGNETWYKRAVMPTLRLLDPERAHNLVIKAAKYALLPDMRKSLKHDNLKTNIWGMEFDNPIGLAAGFDKHGEAVDNLFKLGFGFIEIGSITPKPQEGNEKPRMFRLFKDKAVINRFGFNSDGHDVVYDRLFNRKKDPVGVMGVNLGKNKTSAADDHSDYVMGVHKFAPLADYLVVNVSSPNTPGLRNLQGREQLRTLLSAVISERKKLQETNEDDNTKILPPLLVKIAPDLTEHDKVDIASVLASFENGIDGIIVSNTTISRPLTLESDESLTSQRGGLSGAPLFKISTQTIKDMYKLTQGRIPIIGVGGVCSGNDAYTKIRAGASLVQLFTSMGYEGPTLIARIKNELSECLERDGFQNVSEAVGADFNEVKVHISKDIN